MSPPLVLTDMERTRDISCHRTCAVGVSPSTSNQRDCDMQNSDVIWENVERHKADLIGLSDRVFDMPETLYNEYRSVAEHRAMLAEKGFRVTENAAGIPTAVLGE